jgi:pyruvate/2-oxoglutarate dehydrogenase complex dihydrolipoamide acyltransferase (E2) component
MVAWAVLKAMQNHPVFRCTISPANQLVLADPFDFGFAVALDNDALDTAVIPDASKLDGPAFIAAYYDALQAVRNGHSRSKANVPLILTSMGGFDVRDAQPLVVPPAIATLFLGEAHWQPAGPQTATLQAALCLSFDHRWLNGAAGARFLQDVKARMEQFSLDQLI